MKNMFPCLTPKQSIVMLRFLMAGVFLAHSVTRIANGTIPRFGNYLDERGFSHGIIWVCIITVVEIAGSILLIAGWHVRCACAAFILQLLVGIYIIHGPKGWFTGEHGAGGMEYSVVLIACFLVIAAADKSVTKTT